MTVPGAIRDALLGRDITGSISGCERLSGGCIHDVQRVSFTDREPLVCKWSRHATGVNQLRAEREGLKALAGLPGQSLVVPRVIGLHESAKGAVLLLEWLARGTADGDAWIQAGQSLAIMHEVEVGARYGFENDNFIGSTPQRNDWHDDWIEFNRNCRFEPQVRQARDAGLVTSSQATRLAGFMESLGRYLPSRPRPSLLHGDLWAGNIVPLDDGRMAIIDPACSIGDGWADVAMMQLFGGVPVGCIEAYAAARTDDADMPMERLAVYQLYHLLNHVNLFGEAYVGRSMLVVEQLLRD